jgi:hypothetical protein
VSSSGLAASVTSMPVPVTRTNVPLIFLDFCSIMKIKYYTVDNFFFFDVNCRKPSSVIFEFVVSNIHRLVFNATFSIPVAGIFIRQFLTARHL